MKTGSNLRALFEHHDDDLVDAWVRVQLATSTLRPDLMTEAQLREQATRFVALVGASLQRGPSLEPSTPEWAEVRALVAAAAAGRAREGFRASETIGFVLSLKEAIFRALDEAKGAAADDYADATRLIDRLALLAADEFQRVRDDIIRRQREEILELSTPVIELWDNIVALPMIGTLDSSRAQAMMESLLNRVAQLGAELAIIDITGVPTVDTLTAHHLLKTVTATRLMGADCIISGVRPQIALTLVQLGVNLGDVVTRSTLAAALALALKRTGRRVVAVESA